MSSLPCLSQASLKAPNAPNAHALAKLILLIALCLVISLITARPLKAADLIGFWDTPQRGGNSFNGAAPDQAYFDALKGTGATWVRLTFSKWPGEGRDFLIGNADSYEGLPAKDLQTLKETLDRAHTAGLKVVIAPLSLPGARWSQQNGGKHDERLWRDKAYWDQSARFWADLARELKDHPAVAAYNIINEPTPERVSDLKEGSPPEIQREWYAKNTGTAHDLPAFYEHVITAIRAVDPLTPVMVDGGWYANAQSFSYWPGPLSDPRVLYSFHMYEPYQATSSPNMKREKPLRYPGVTSWFGPEQVTWDKTMIARYLASPFDWAKANGIPANRMVAGEFGCMRLWADCGAYLTDVMDVLEGHKTHWAFYAFREDVWDGMDYELGTEVKPGQFYYLTEQGQGAKLKRTGPLMTLIKARLKP